MSPHPLDNPVWHSLASVHAGLAIRNGNTARYPRALAPFIAVGAADEQAGLQLAPLVEPDETAFLVGIAPPMPPGLQITHEASIVQMVCDSRLDTLPGPEITALSAAHRDDMLALIALVYPGYFRARTPELGNYLGIYCDGRLAAMAGERMHLQGYQEISAVCTHPDFQGRGLARLLVAALVNQIHDRGDIPFLHTEHDNLRARALYERLGFKLRNSIPIWSIQSRGGLPGPSA